MREKVHLLISVKFRMENEALPSIYSEPETISIKQKIKMSYPHAPTDLPS